jgi:hypothetical protein
MVASRSIGGTGKPAANIASRTLLASAVSNVERLGEVRSTIEALMVGAGANDHPFARHLNNSWERNMPVV